MNKLIILFIVLSVKTLAFAQEYNFKFPETADYPNLPKFGKSINDFVPKNWKVFGKASGDLNGDGQTDYVLVLKATYSKFLNKNESQIFNTNPRILVILFKENNGYRIAKQNNEFVFVPDSPSMSEPFQKVKINNRVLQLDFELWYSAGSWSASNYSYKFRFQNGNFYLIGIEKTEWIRNSGETETRSYNFLTNKVKIMTGDIQSEEKKIEWKNFRVIKLKTLDTFKAPFTWEIEYDYYV